MEDLNLFSRRNFLKGAGALGITGLALWTGGCEACWKKIRERPTRRNIANLPAGDPIIETYKDAVQKMKDLPPGDGRNWNKQADIHNNKCPHQNWWFLPWHRAYLVNFESICRKLTGNNDFALPYWNWTTSPSIPGPFWEGSLLNTTRVATPTSVADPSAVGAATITSILSQTNFFLFASAAATTQRQRTAYGALERTPHNYIHGFVDGDMSTFRSPLDPIFWCHHNMIECLWVHWNLDMGNANTNDPAWGNMTFTDDFVDGDGNPAPIQVSTTLLFPILTYQYEPCAPGAPPPKRDKATLEKFLREGGPHKLEFIKRFELRRPIMATLQRSEPSRIKVEPEAFRTVLDISGREKAVLTIDEVEPPAKQDVFVRVFINKPDASAADSIDDPHYAGSFAFFCCEDEAMAGHETGTPATSPAPHGTPGATAPSKLPKLQYLVDVTPTIRKLSQAGSLSSDLDVTLVTVPIEEKRPVQTQRLNVGRLELAVASF